MSEQKLSRRGLPIFKNNPSVQTAITSMKTGVKRISNAKGDEMIVANATTGEIVAGIGLGFHQKVKVDKTQFVKLYIQGVSAFTGLSKTGARILEMVISESHQNPGKDLLFISPANALEYFVIPKQTYMRGIKELLEREVLFETMNENWYFINVNYMFNGDRLAFLKTYELDVDANADIENDKQGRLFD
ncbi:MAG: hypothetical protein PHE67_04665 [Campylobacterales bacterium]|nr:hypothetical protein [Campylobacterales bacterium]